MSPPACDDKHDKHDEGQTTSYLINIRTGQMCSLDEYTEAAGQLFNGLQSIFGDLDTVLTMVRPKHKRGEPLLHAAQTEVVVSMDDGLCAQCMLVLHAEVPYALDKPLLGTLLKATLPWPNLRVEKQMMKI